MKLNKKIRKRLTKPVRKLIKRHGADAAVELVTAFVAATASGAIASKKAAKRREAAAAD